MIVSEVYSARSWAKETGKNSGKEQILNSVNLLIYIVLTLSRNRQNMGQYEHGTHGINGTYDASRQSC